MSDFFEVFGLERRLAVDEAALQRRFYELSRRWHPDFHQAASPEQQARALQESARVNAAYRALRDPIARAEYLVRLEEGRATSADRATGGETLPGSPSNKERPKAPPALLAEMFEIQEALQEAKAGPLDAAARASLAEQRDALKGRLAATEAQLVGPLSRAWDASAVAERPAALDALKAALATRAYLRTVIDDLADALGEGSEEAHAANRRH